MTHRFLRSFSGDRPSRNVPNPKGEMTARQFSDPISVSADESLSETVENQSSATVSSISTELTVQSGRPVELYIPELYEPNYAYPLLVWLHGSGGSEAELSSLMPEISLRNHFGIAFRGSQPGDEDRSFGFHWSQTDEEYAEFRQSLYETVCLLRRRYHIHSEQIFIAGFDDGATLALRLLLDRPEWFGGAVALAGDFPRQQTPLVRFRELRGQQIFIGCGSRDHRLSPAEMVRVGRLLHAAGMEVSTQIFDADHEVTPAMLAQLNRFILDSCCTTV